MLLIPADTPVPLAPEDLQVGAIDDAHRITAAAVPKEPCLSEHSKEAPVGLWQGLRRSLRTFAAPTVDNEELPRLHRLEFLFQPLIHARRLFQPNLGQALITKDARSRKGVLHPRIASLRVADCNVALRGLKVALRQPGSILDRH